MKITSLILPLAGAFLLSTAVASSQQMQKEEKKTEPKAATEQKAEPKAETKAPAKAKKSMKKRCCSANAGLTPLTLEEGEAAERKMPYGS